VAPGSFVQNFAFVDRSGPFPSFIMGSFTRGPVGAYGQLVTFFPSQPLAHLRAYHIEVTGGSFLTGALSARGAMVADWFSALDDFGGYLLSDVDVVFETPDPDALLVHAVSPTGDTSGGYVDQVSRDTLITVTFSEPVSGDVCANPASYARFVSDAGDSPVAAGMGFNATGDELLIDPVAKFDYSTVYRNDLQYGAAIESWRATSRAGWLEPTGTQSYRFKTIDPPDLALLATSPSDQYVGFGDSTTDQIDVKLNVQLAFSERVTQALFESLFRFEACTDSSCGTMNASTPSLNSWPPEASPVTTHRSSR
jgi:hypothetical protein